jgi:hypothetical protein
MALRDWDGAGGRAGGRPHRPGLLRCVVGEQSLEPDLQALGAFPIVPGKGRCHPPSEQILGALSQDCRSLAQGPVGGVVQGDVEQDLAVPVGVVRGQDVDR